MGDCCWWSCTQTPPKNRARGAGATPALPGRADSARARKHLISRDIRSIRCRLPMGCRRVSVTWFRGCWEGFGWKSGSFAVERPSGWPNWAPHLRLCRFRILGSLRWPVQAPGSLGMRLDWEARLGAHLVTA